MRIAIFADSHLIAPNDQLKEHHIKRAHMASGWESFRALLHLIKRESPELLISLGDLVDWYSEENVDFAISLLEEIQIPWVMVPGNHDLDNLNPNDTVEESRRKCRLGWKQKGVDLHNRVLELGEKRLFLLDTSSSDVLEGTGDWVENLLTTETVNLVFSHVPLNTPEMQEYIVSVQPNKNLKKYILTNPEFYHRYLHNKVAKVYTGHLHFTGELKVGDTVMHLLSTSFIATGRSYPGMGMAAILDVDTLENRIVYV